jgi:hypothetical protein
LSFDVKWISSNDNPYSWGEEIKSGACLCVITVDIANERQTITASPIRR